MKGDKMKVKLAAKPNPDFDDRSLQGTIEIQERWFEIGTLREASVICRRFIEINDLGGGNWTGGDVKDDAGNVIAHISYNGRVWEDWGTATPKEIQV